ncbi:serine hydrolase [Cohnella sp. LGH]|uniref:serine hydrolase domain-containing protein n=1 Tax=Cohnella sp. LGH TaxID=1619153 RepID=UPI001ADB2F9E|nr:serine hydrolase [Cohnella sp. LGH]QTH43161.1 serine hydrolase [Cohnella sp. LGH]
MSRDVRRKFIIGLLSLFIFVTGCGKTENAIPAASSTPTPTSVSSDPIAVDGPFEWPEAKPAEAGIDEAKLQKIDEAVATKHKKTLSVLIVKDGRLVYERYYQHKGKDDPTGVFSVVKSVTSALVGIAIDKGYMKGVDQKLSELLPDLFANVDDERKKQITVKHALTLTVGLESNDENMFSSLDLGADTLAKPMVNEPGETFIYNTGMVHLLSIALTKASHMTTKQFAKKYLFEPLNITEFEWSTDLQGYYNGGTLLSLRPRDMAKLGYLYLQKGKWQGDQIVSESWVEESFTRYVTAEETYGYGYLFWLSEFKDKSGNPVSVYEASGYGGQHIQIIPQWDTVIVVTSDHESKDDSISDKLILDYVIPAIQPE